MSLLESDNFKGEKYDFKEGGNKKTPCIMNANHVFKIKNLGLFSNL